MLVQVVSMVFCSFKSCPRKGASCSSVNRCKPFFAGFKSCPRKGASVSLIWDNRDFKFQVMPPQGGILETVESWEITQEVSSHAPARGHQAPLCAEIKSSPVSSHAPARGHRIQCCHGRQHNDVSSHAPARGHLVQFVCKAAAGAFQVMPPQGGI